MALEFEIKLDYCLEDFDAYWKAFYLKRPWETSRKQASPRMHRNVGLFFLAMGVLTAFILRPPVGGLGIIFGLMEMVLGLMLLYSGIYLGSPQSSSRWAKRVWKQYQTGGVLYSCRFTEEGVWVYDSKSDHRYDYDALTALWEDAGRFYLLLPGQRQGAYILNKERFTAGTPADLPAFWEDKTGRPVEPVK